jgi:hypothetical protein
MSVLVCLLVSFADIFLIAVAATKAVQKSVEVRSSPMSFFNDVKENKVHINPIYFRLDMRTSRSHGNFSEPNRSR